MLSLGIPALRIIGLCLPFVGFSIATSSAFQALGKGYYSMLVSICRQLLFLLPTAYLLAKTGCAAECLVVHCDCGGRGASL